MEIRICQPIDTYGFILLQLELLVNHSNTLIALVVVFQTGIDLKPEERYRHENNGIFFNLLSHVASKSASLSL